MTVGGRGAWGALAVVAILGTALYALGIWAALPSQRIRDIQASLDADEEAPATIVVAVFDVPPGHALQARDLTVHRLPPDYVPTGAYRSVDQVVGRRTPKKLLADEAVRVERLAP